MTGTVAAAAAAALRDLRRAIEAAQASLDSSRWTQAEREMQRALTLVEQLERDGARAEGHAPPCAPAPAPLCPTD